MQGRGVWISKGEAGGDLTVSVARPDDFRVTVGVRGEIRCTGVLQSRGTSLVHTYGRSCSWWGGGRKMRE